MDRTTITTTILNGQTTEQTTSLLVWGIVGFILSSLLEVLRHKQKIKKSGGFSFVFWLKDNFVRMIVSLITIIIGVLFSEEIIGKPIGNFSALLAGFVTDKIIEGLVKFKSIININFNGNSRD